MLFCKGSATIVKPLSTNSRVDCVEQHSVLAANLDRRWPILATIAIGGVHVGSARLACIGVPVPPKPVGCRRKAAIIMVMHVREIP